MKKTLLIISSLILILSSCSDKNVVNIAGINLHEKFNGDTIYLLQNNEDLTAPIFLDSTVIADGKYSFATKSGNTSVLLGLMNKGLVRTTDYADGFVSAYIISEPGNITVDYSAVDPSIKGTSANDDLQAYFDTMNSYKEKLRGYTGSIYGAKTKDEENIIRAERDSIYDSYRTEVMPYLQEFVKIEAGASYLIFFIDDLLSDKDKLGLLEFVPEKMQNNELLINTKNELETKIKSEVGNIFVDIHGKTIDGKDMSLSDIAGKGKYVLIDFWASWCGPCIAEMPRMKKIYDKYKDKDFVMFGVSIDQNKNAWLDASKKHGVVWNQMLDDKGWDSKSLSAYNVFGIPSVILLDKEGIIIGKFIYGDKLENRLKELMQ